MKKKDVSINIRTVQGVENDKDTTELFTLGNLSRRRGNGYTLTYTESDVTGYAGHKVSLDITGENMVVMRRSGNYPATLSIEKGRKHHCHYSTPYGDFTVGITGADVICNVGESGGDMYLKYTVDVNSALMTENEMYIDFKEERNTQ